MSEPCGLDFDDVADVVCVGSGPGLRAYGIACAEAGLDVLPVALPAGGPDPETAALLAAMTADLDEVAPETELPASVATPAAIRRDRRTPVEPFVGEHLRLWSARCLASRSGVMFTHVPDDVLVPMRTGAGELITVAALPRCDLAAAEPPDTLSGLVFEDGRLRGCALDGPAGRRLVRADRGLAFAVGPGGAIGPGPLRSGTSLALVGRPAGRFARLELVTVDD